MAPTAFVDFVFALETAEIDQGLQEIFNCVMKSPCKEISDPGQHRFHRIVVGLHGRMILAAAVLYHPRQVSKRAAVQS